MKLSQKSIDLELLGATAVEDALQDNVRDTLVAIRRAGILVWILTGDKVETAYNISKSCGHIADNAKLYFITECKEEQQIYEHFDTISEEISVGAAENAKKKPEKFAQMRFVT